MLYDEINAVTPNMATMFGPREQFYVHSQECILYKEQLVVRKI